MSDEADQDVLAQNVGRFARLLDEALTVMNDAVLTTVTEGPAVAMDRIGTYLDNCDAISEEAANTPDDWLARWTVMGPAEPPSETA